MKLIIFSYPLHFNIMQLAYRNAINVIDDIDEVVVVWDDLFEKDCNKNIVTEQILKVIPANKIIFHSDIDLCLDEQLGWLRQQYIKLNLHSIFDGNNWVILDSDVILRQKKTFVNNNKLVIYNDPNDYYQPYFDFIKYVFDIDKNNSPSYMTHYALFEREVLEHINLWCTTKHGKNIVMLFKEFYRPLKNSTYKEPMTPPLSEFEIYGLFCERVLKKPLLTVMYETPNCLPDQFQKIFNKGIECFYEGKDYELPDDFWCQNNVTLYNT